MYVFQTIQEIDSINEFRKFAMTLQSPSFCAVILGFLTIGLVEWNEILRFYYLPSTWNIIIILQMFAKFIHYIIYYSVVYLSSNQSPKVWIKYCFSAIDLVDYSTAFNKEPLLHDRQPSKH